MDSVSENTRDRKLRLLVIEKLFDKAKEEETNIDEERLIADCCLNWGSARRTILEYLKQLELSGRIDRIKKDNQQVELKH